MSAIENLIGDMESIRVWYYKHNEYAYYKDIRELLDRYYEESKKESDL